MQKSGSETSQLRKQFSRLTLSQLWSFKIRGTTFSNYIKLGDLLILRPLNRILVYNIEEGKANINQIRSILYPMLEVSFPLFYSIEPDIVMSIPV